LLARVHFPLPDPLLLAQLADPEDVVGRLIAVERLAERKDHTAIAQLQERLAQDKFYGVRVEAARGLAKIHTPEALEALLAAPPQPEARVRQAVVAGLGRFYDARACAAARATLETESNPAIVIEAIEALGAYHQPEIAARLRRYLETPSYRNELAEAALGAIRLQDDPAYLDPVLDCLGRREREFTTFGLARGLETAAYLARNQTNKDTVRDFLLARVNHPQQRIRLAALRALGTLGDPQAIAVVERFAAGAKDSPERGAAEPSLRALRAGRKPVDDLKNLRDELLALQQANRELRRELDDLKKRLEALPPPAAEVKARKKPAAGKAR
jgi:aminopeptidase N